MTGPITSHFSWEELTRTEVRDLLLPNRAALDADPAAQEAVRRVCVEMLEPLRSHFVTPIIVHSGYRCPALNERIGGSKTSQHMRGEAADFHVAGVPLSIVFAWIRASAIPFGQVILEGAVPSWVHWSLGTRREALIYDGHTYRHPAV